MLGGKAAARRVVAKVEHHAGETFSRFGFIVTGLAAPSRAVVRLNNKRDTAEQWKRGKASGEDSPAELPSIPVQ